MKEGLEMAKRLYDVLSKCNDEEEVKSEFAKYFKLKLITHKYKIDLYTNSTLFEFKHDRNLSSQKERAKVVAQTLYYVRKLKFGSSTDPVPELICVVDKNEGFFIKTSDFHQFYNAGAKYDWDRAASQPCPVLVEALKKSDLINDIHVYSFEDPTEEKYFEEVIYMAVQKPLLLNEKKEILAFEITKLVHGEEEARKALEAARALFSGEGDDANMPTTENE